MKQWPKVAWSDAGQVLELMSDASLAGDDTSVEPHVFFDNLVAGGNLSAAANFVGHALPRYEGIAWAVQTLLSQGAIERSSPLVTAILRWVDNPDDDRRRAVWDLAEKAPDGTPAKLLGMAVFMSGGSISEPDLHPVLPPPGVSAKLATAAVSVAAYARPDPSSLLKNAVEIGRQAASQGAKG